MALVFHLIIKDLKCKPQLQIYQIKHFQSAGYMVNESNFVCIQKWFTIQFFYYYEYRKYLSGKALVNDTKN